jgi:dGTPase
MFMSVSFRLFAIAVHVNIRAGGTSGKDGTAMRALYYCDPAHSRGRLVDEEESAHRSCFQRDRDRIIHSSAFRRLKHKTQVFVEHEGDYYRTRLTHSIEVAQVARTIAASLGLNVELTEAIALAHDLGHTPFGHTGEDALDAMMAPYGGFDHNAQAVKIVTSLERHYAEFDGLNLTWETLEGLAKHNGPVTGDLPHALAGYNARHDLELHTHASAEAQVAALSDDIAYNNHDLHDGLRAGLFTDADIMELPIISAAYAEVDAAYPDLDRERRMHEALRRVFGVMVSDVIATSRANLAQSGVQTAQDVRDFGRPVVMFSNDLWRDLKVIRSFLFTRMYRAPSVMVVRAEVTKVVEALFPLYLSRTDLLPAAWRSDVARAQGDTEMARIVCDYISGMTDRFAQQEYDRLLGG